MIQSISVLYLRWQTMSRFDPISRRWCRHLFGESSSLKYGSWSFQLCEFYSFTFPVHLHRAAHFIMEEVWQASLLGCLALRRFLFLFVPLVLLAEVMYIPDSEGAIVGSGVQWIVVDLDAIYNEWMPLENALENSRFSIKCSGTGIAASCK